MNKVSQISRIMIAGTNSGSGKTTVACALLKAFVMRGLSVSAFKCGPDFIDPMFHSKILSLPSSNLDLFLCGEERVKTLLADNAENSDIAVIEGVMGFYDGMGGSLEASSYDLSEKTDTPVVLVVDCKGMSLSVNALLSGFLRYRQNRVKGVVLNHISEGMYPSYRDNIERELGVKVLGFLPRLPAAKIESRHLGLVTAGEIADLSRKIDILGRAAQKYIDIAALLAVAKEAPPLSYEEPEIQKEGKVTVAVAADEAFCFYYADALRLLEKLGAKLAYFSPLRDPALPEADGLILGGGYPELYLETLSKNRSLLSDIKNKIEGGLPVLAECGGFMLLLEGISDEKGRFFPMAGVFKGGAKRQERLARFGYATLTAKGDNLLCRAGETIKAHEFHYYDSENNGDAFAARKPLSGKSWQAIHASQTMFCGFPHIHLCQNPNLAGNFISACAKRQRGISRLP